MNLGTIRYSGQIFPRPAPDAPTNYLLDQEVYSSDAGAARVGDIAGMSNVTLIGIGVAALGLWFLMKKKGR